MQCHKYNNKNDKILYSNTKIITKYCIKSQKINPDLSTGEDMEFQHFGAQRRARTTVFQHFGAQQGRLCKISW